MKKFYIKKVDLLLRTTGLSLLIALPLAQHFINPKTDYMTIAENLWVPMALGLISLTTSFIKTE